MFGVDYMGQNSCISHLMGAVKQGNEKVIHKQAFIGLHTYRGGVVHSLGEDYYLCAL